MVQFGVYPNPRPHMRALYTFVLVVQSELLKALATRLVVPLARTSLPASSLLRCLCPLVQVKGQSLVLVSFKAAPLDKRQLSSKAATLRERADDIALAMTAVLSGV